MQAFYNKDLPQTHKGHGWKLMVRKKKLCMLNKLTSLHENLDNVNDKMGEKWITLFSAPPPPRHIP